MLEKKLKKISVRKANILEHEKCSKSAVLVPLLQYENEPYFLFEKRSYKLNKQPGEVCFPGGAIEKHDKNARQAAIRESCEELSLAPDDIELLAPLDVFVGPLNNIVYPFLAYIKSSEKIKANPEEVEYVFCVPLEHLLNSEPLSKDLGITLNFPDDYPFDLVPKGKEYPYPRASFSQKFYFWQDEIIWGLTARILFHVLDLFKD
jgi:8-oxo-dGTP pyrophosphatase MutT (NUDIX family)